MSEIKYEKYIESLDCKKGISTYLIEKIETELNVKFPNEYKKFISMYNGCEGPIGENSYIQLWQVEELLTVNRKYSIDQNFPELLAFGTDGGGTAYAFDKRLKKMPIVYFEFSVIDIEDVFPCAETFRDFLEYLYNE